MADRVRPTPPPPPAPAPRHDDQQQPHAAAPAAGDETTPPQQQPPSFNRATAPPPGTYIIQVPKDQVLRVPPPDRARRYKKLAARPARRRRLHRACCISLCGVFVLLLLAAAFAGAVYLVFRPRAPGFSVASLSVTGLENTTTTTTVVVPSSSAVQVTAAVRADNGRNKKVGVDYRGGGEVTVAYAGERLAAGAWPSFYQPPRNVTVFSMSLSGDGVTFSDEQRRRLAAEQAARAVPLTVEARVPLRVRFGKVLRTWTVDVKATCDVAVDRLDGPAAVVNNGCRVKVKPLWWWW